MSDPIRLPKDLMRQALRPTPECPPIEALAAAQQDGPVKEHVLHCPHCRAELALLRQFESAEAGPEEAADLMWVQSQLAERSPVGFQGRESLGDRVRGWFEFLFSPAGRGRLSLAAAVLLVLVAAGIFLRHGGGARPGPSEDSTVWRSGQIAVASPVGDLGRAPTRLQWEAVAGAVSYHVRLLEVDDTEVWSTDSASTSVDFPNDVAIRLTPGRAFQWEAVARDRAGRQLATTDLQTFHILVTTR